MPQITYGQQPQWMVGQIATNEDAVIDTLTNELLAQISTLTVGGVAADGIYSATVEGPDGEQLTVSFNRAAAETNDAIADALFAAINADDAWANVATGSDGGAAVADVNFIHPGRVYTWIATSAPGGATLTAANSQASGGVSLQLGVMVQEGSADDLGAALGAGVVDDDLAGILVRGEDALRNDFGEQNDLYAPGSTLSVLRRGTVAVLVEDAVTKGADVFTRITNPVGADPVGLFRSDAAGGDAIEVTGARYASTTTGRGIALVRINRP